MWFGARFASDEHFVSMSDGTAVRTRAVQAFRVVHVWSQEGGERDAVDTDRHFDAEHISSTISTKSSTPKKHAKNEIEFPGSPSMTSG